MPHERRLVVTVVTALALILAGLLTAILVLCHGQLIYSLDDPYISLALGDQVAHGHYGINAAEYSSPSSSILFPFLLAAFAWTPWPDWTPFVVNSLAALATAALFACEACRLGIVTRREQIPAAATLIVALCLAINTAGLVFIGLEHSLHALTSLVVVFGLARVLEGGRVSRGLVVAIVLLPLWRFEGLALAGLTIAALAAACHWRPALTASAAIAVALGAYMTLMAHLGLPLLPSSVLVKSDVVHVGGVAALWLGLSTHLRDSLTNPEAYPVFLLLALVAARPLAQPRRIGRQWLFAGVTAGALAAHILFGAWGWFARYEAYAVAIGAAGAIVLWRGAIAGFVERRGIAPMAAALVVLCVVGRYYLMAEVATPVASLGIYEQHYQMHRFAADFYRRPVGVNDIGWVSYRNSNYVLDLWGLGSEEARTMRAAAASDPAWLGRLVASHAVGVVMIYDQWFPGQIPASWRKIAALKAAHRITAAFDTVTFYATGPDAVSAALAALSDFGRTLPPGTSLTITGPANLVAGEPR